jgi:hypothetical protein
VGWTRHVRHCAIWATAIMNWTRPHRVVEAQGEDEARHLPENQLGIISKNGHESHEKKKKKKNIYI